MSKSLSSILLVFGVSACIADVGPEEGVTGSELRSKATITVTPDRASVGDTVTVTGCGFPARLRYMSYIKVGTQSWPTAISADGCLPEGNRFYIWERDAGSTLPVRVMTYKNRHSTMTLAETTLTVQPCPADGCW